MTALRGLTLSAGERAAAARGAHVDATATTPSDVGQAGGEDDHTNSGLRCYGYVFACVFGTHGGGSFQFANSTAYCLQLFVVERRLSSIKVVDSRNLCVYDLGKHCSFRTSGRSL